MGEERNQEKQKNKAIKDKIIRDIRNFVEKEEEDYYKPVRLSNFWSNNYIEYKIMLIEAKHCRLKNISIELGHT